MTEELDLRGVPCPANAARAVLQLSTMGTGEILLLHVDDGEPIENVSRSIEVAGHEIVRREKKGEAWALEVRAA